MFSLRVLLILGVVLVSSCSSPIAILPVRPWSASSSILTAGTDSAGAGAIPFMVCGAFEIGPIPREFAPVAERKVIEPETADRVMQLLREVVISGTGRKARVEGFEIAGKTGTAQKIDAAGRYSMIDHVASFVGFFPASRPQIAISLT